MPLTIRSDMQIEALGWYEYISYVALYGIYLVRTYRIRVRPLPVQPLVGVATYYPFASSICTTTRTYNTSTYDVLIVLLLFCCCGIIFAERMTDRPLGLNPRPVMQYLPYVRAEGGQGLRRVHGRGTQQEVPLLPRPPGEFTAVILYVLVIVRRGIIRILKYIAAYIRILYEVYEEQRHDSWRTR